MGKTKHEPKVTIVDKPQTINVEYQLLVAERDDLLVAEDGYRKRIKEVEREKAELLHSFDILYNENALLRSKLDAPEGIGIDSLESYNAVYKDRLHLREANRAYKRRIKQLEDDANVGKKDYESLNTNYLLLTQKAELEVGYATKNRDEKINILEKEQDDLSEKLRMFLKEREQYEYRIAEMDKEMNELQNKYDFLETDKHELQLRCDVLHADREKLKEKVLDLEASLPDPEQKAKEEQQFLALQGQLAALQVANTDAKVEIHKLNEEIRELSKLKRANVETFDRACSVMVDEEAEEKRRTDNEKRDELLKELEQSKQSGMFLLKENDRMKTENAELESKAANFELENKKLQNDINQKKTELENMSVVISGNQSLNQDYNIVTDKLNDLTAAKQVLEKELIQQKRNAKLKQAELNNELEKTQQQVKDLQKQFNKAEHEANTLQFENEGLTKVTEAQALELRNMKSQIEQIQNMLEDKTLKYEQMKKTEKEALAELQETRIQYHTVKREHDNLMDDKAGDFVILKREMETAKAQRDEETEQLREESAMLKEEVKKLKDYEFRITTLDAEIRRLMNRIRMAERYKKIADEKSGKIERLENDPERQQIRELKKKQREWERERMGFLQERRQWDILKEKYSSLQQNNKRLMEENKRVRGDLDGTTYKIESLEKRFKVMNVKITDIKVPEKPLRAMYVEKESQPPKDGLMANYSHLLDKSSKTSHLKASKPVFTKVREETEVLDRPRVRQVPKPANDQQPKTEPSKEHKVQNGGAKAKARKKVDTMTKSQDRKKTERKLAAVKSKAKSQTLPKLSSQGTGIYGGKGYKELHKERYAKPSQLALL